MQIQYDDSKMIDRDYYEEALGYAEKIREKTDFVPEIAIVLGSGFNDFAEQMDAVATVDYASLEGFPQCSAEGHVGRFVFGMFGSRRVAVMQGRVHYYEGYPVSDIVLPLRVLHLLGAETVFFTNAAGSMTERLQPGDFMAFSDQLSFLIPSPVRGKSNAQFGAAFPDTANMFDADLRELVLSNGNRLGLSMKEGVYIQAPGPQYESPAEMRAYAAWGADAVGMSTAVEAIAARQMGMRICAVSLITNMESGVAAEVKPLTHEDVLRIANIAVDGFSRLMAEVIPQI